MAFDTSAVRVVTTALSFIALAGGKGRTPEPWIPGLNNLFCMYEVRKIATGGKP